MSIPSVTQSHVYGAKSDIRNSLAYLDEQTVLYPAGANLVLYNVEQKTQKFIPISDGDIITAMCVSPNKRYAAIAERGHEKPILSIFDLNTTRKRKSLVPSDGGSCKEYISVCFSNDGRFLITQTGGADWLLSYWSWEKGKVVASIKTNNNSNCDIAEVSLNPYDRNQVQICVVGNNLMRIFRYIEGSLRPWGSQKVEQKNYLCHTWISEDRILVGTEDSKILVYDSGELRFDVSYGGANLGGPPPAIHAIIETANGFMVGTSTGQICGFEQAEDTNSYKKGKEIQLDSAKVNTIALGPTDDIAAVTLSNNQIFSITFSGTDVTQADDAKVELLAQSFHFGAIVGLDTCIRKPLLATCSSDKSVRIWNYHENTVEVVKYFQDEPQSIAIDPSGLYVLIGFADSLKLMNVLIDDIRPMWESNTRGCRECRFSNGGQYFATVLGQSILIYSTWSCQPVYTLRGHQGKVKSVSWSADDTHLVSCGLDGAIMDWNVKTQHVEFAHSKEGTQYISSVYCMDSKTIYAVGNDCLLKELSDGQVTREVPSHVLLTQVLISRSGRMMFTATDKGGVRAMKFPLGTDAGEYQEQKIHVGAVTRLKISHDDLTLFSCGEDGCLVVYKVTDKENRAAKREKDNAYSDEILVAKKDIKDNLKEMSTLRSRVDELRAENDMQLRAKEQSYSDKIRDTTDRFTVEIDALRRLTGHLREERQGNARKHEADGKDFRFSNRKELNEITQGFASKMKAEKEKYTELETQTAQLQEQWNRQMKQTEAAEQEAVSGLMQYYQEMLTGRQEEILRYQTHMTSQVREFESNTTAIEDDVDTEIVALRHDFERRLFEERESVQQIKQENTVMKKKFEKLSKEIVDNKTELNKMFVEERKLHNIIKSLEKDILGVKREMQERDDTIQDKKKRVYDLKKKNQELEKFKFVLDYKIVELKKQVEPREIDIIELSKIMRDMDLEINQYQSSHTASDIAIGDLLLKVQAKDREAAAEAGRYKEHKHAVTKIQQDLIACYLQADNPKALRNSVLSIYHKYETHTNDIILPALLHEDDPFRNRTYYEKTVSTLENKRERDKVLRRSDNEKVIMENVMLTHEVNYLRRELKIRQSRLENAENPHAYAEEEIEPDKGFKLPPVSLPPHGIFTEPLES